MLVSTARASEILGISVQGVHYRIKKGLLKSQKQDGRVFVYLDKNLKPKNKTNENTQENTHALLNAKEEQINLLKESIVWMKEQYSSEINRLESNQDKIIDVFKSEILLLQQAYNEMQSILKIDNSAKNNDIKEINIDEDIKFMDIKDFFKFMMRNGKTSSQIKIILLEQIKKSDKRFIYKKETKEIIIFKSDFIDLI